VAYTQCGRLAQAVICLRQAVAIQHELAEPHGEAVSLDHLGQALLAIGCGDEARASWQRALGIFTKLEHPQADVIAARLDAQARTPLRARAAITALP
jgi:tetratricopeptide (TPR) repeat protein